MYSTCLFCNNTLGANESIEHFPVGRRLAFDAAKGRLWVVCKKCERWNLSPLETRWEAIEEAERLFRGTKLRVSTDNIGLAQLKDGTELVRIGAPPKVEFAAWRYGDQFGKRQRIFIAQAGGIFVGARMLAEFAISPTTFLNNPTQSLIGGTIFGMLFCAYGAKKVLRDRLMPRLSVHDQQGIRRRLSIFDAQGATISPAGHAFEWQLRVPYRDVRPAPRILQKVGIKELGSSDETVVMRDDVARRALSNILPHANLMGGGKRAVKGAVDVVNSAPNVQYLLHRASVSAPIMPAGRVRKGEVAISALPSELRLALEMSIHESDERRAMEGELHELEARWKDAEAIAKIADEMFLPENIDTTLNELRPTNNPTGRSE